MKTVYEFNVTEAGGYKFYQEEFQKTGIFFQSPIQKIDWRTAWDCTDNYPFVAEDFVDRCKKSRLFRWMNIILGNKNQVEKMANWLEDWNFAAATLTTIVCPIYFKRTYRTLKAYATDSAAEIQQIHSVGYESPYNYCSGACYKESTWMVTKHTLKHFVNRKNFHYTYKHVILNDVLKVKKA